MVTVFDLDDTLYNEIDFVKSGFQAVASSLSGTSDRYYETMWNYFLKQGSGKVFNHLIDTFNIPLSIDEMVRIYRSHTPSIILSDLSVTVLKAARELGPTALITDGAAQMQIEKFNALGLSEWIDFPVFTDLYGTKKPEPLAFEMIMDHFHLEQKFVYLSDNPNKDFFAPNQLDWLTIRYKNPDGIYRDAISNAMHEITSLDCAIPLLQTYAKEK